MHKICSVFSPAILRHS